MKKRISVIEQIMLYNVIVLTILSIIILFACNGKFSFTMVEMAFRYSYLVLFKGELIQKIAFILIIILFLTFIGYWITNIIIDKKFVFGPFYILLFFLLFIYTEGYYGYIDIIDTYVVMMIFLLVVLAASTIISFVYYLKEKKKNLKEGELVDEQ